MKIVIYSKNECVYCDNARKLLSDKNKEFKEFKLHKDFSRELIREVFPTARTFPIIVIDEKYIGGYTNLEEIAKGWNHD